MKAQSCELWFKMGEDGPGFKSHILCLLTLLLRQVALHICFLTYKLGITTAPVAKPLSHGCGGHSVVLGDNDLLRWSEQLQSSGSRDRNQLSCVTVAKIVNFSEFRSVLRVKDSMGLWILW